MTHPTSEEGSDGEGDRVRQQVRTSLRRRLLLHDLEELRIEIENRKRHERDGEVDQPDKEPVSILEDSARKKPRTFQRPVSAGDSSDRLFFD